MRNKRPNIKILSIRGQKVVLDSDLAAVYGVTTKRLNEQFRRNRKRFPEDFAFQLTAEEFATLTSQVATLDEGGSSREPVRSQPATASSRSQSMRSQFATASQRNIRYRPWAFTEHGALQAANVLRTDRAIAMSVYVIRAFIEQREKLAANAAILKRLAGSIRRYWNTTPPYARSTRNFYRFLRLCRNLRAAKSDFILRHRRVASID
jgi:hypothetical protein